MKRNAWPYVAGIVDGEGSILISKWERSDSSGMKTELRIKICNTNFTLIKWLMANFGGRFRVDVNNRRHGAYSTPQRSRPLYEWGMSGKANKEKFLLGIIPHLLLKREQAMLALEYLRIPDGWNSELRLQMAQKMHLLNHPIQESPTTNTLDIPQYTDFRGTEAMKIESELHGDAQSEPDVNQDS